MNLKISLGNTWHTAEHDSVRFSWKGDPLCDQVIMDEPGILSLFSSVQPGKVNGSTEFNDLLLRFNGSFAFIVEYQDHLLCVADRIRSIPLFFAINPEGFTLSDDAYALKDQISHSLSEPNSAEFLATGYVTGPETLVNEIHEIQAGEYLIYTKSEGKYTVYPWFRYLHGDFSDNTEEQLLRGLDTVMTGVFNRLLDTTVRQGKTIVVPLSGGLDSRLIVAMLKRLGARDVICFTYGKKGNRESEVSRKVAEALGFPWYFVEYSGRRWRDWYRSDEMRAYERYCSNLTSSPHFQDFLAVKILKNEGKIPDNAVFVPGHSGDMLAGSWIPKDIGTLDHTYDQFVTHTLEQHYSLGRWKEDGDKDLDTFFQNRIRKSVGELMVTDAESLASAIEYFNFKERQAKFIVNSVRVYEYFGYEWRIPLWDSELIDFFLHIPLKFRLDQSLYNTYCYNEVFKTDLASLSHIPCNTYGEKSLLASVKDFVFRKIPRSRAIAINLYKRYKLMGAYSSDPLNMYTLMSKSEFKKFYSDHANFNTFISENFMARLRAEEDLVAHPEKMIKEKNLG